MDGISKKFREIQSLFNLLDEEIGQARNTLRCIHIKAEKLVNQAKKEVEKETADISNGRDSVG